jgi:hypothetical protein
VVTATDRARAARLKHHLERFGVRVSVELQDGAGGSDSRHTDFRAIMSHHTASRPSQGPTPILGIVKRGRTGLPGPLANGYGGYDHVYRILTMGKANHPGAGGPFTFLGMTIPANNGRPYCFGTEFEGGYEQYDAGMRDFMARANAGIVSWLAEERGKSALAYVEALLEHKTWAPRRKPDRIGYTRDTSIAETRKILTAAAKTTAAKTSEEDDDMPDIIFFSFDKNGEKHLYGTVGNAAYTHISNEADYKNIRKARTGHEPVRWQNAAKDETVANPSGFGAYVGPDHLRPKGH